MVNAIRSTWGLPLHALKHDSDLEAPGRFARNETKFRERRFSVFGRTQKRRGIADRAAERAFDKARPRGLREVSLQQPPA